MTAPAPLAEAAQIDALADYVSDFIAKRFPEGLPDQMHTIMAECVLDAHVDGMKRGELQLREEMDRKGPSRVITLS